MRDASTAALYSATSLSPGTACEHSDDVVEVHAEPGFRLFVRFQDNTSGIVDVSALIASPKAGIFKELADPERFAEVRIELGAVTWPSGLDIAPDAMYAALRECGFWALV